MPTFDASITDFVAGDRLEVRRNVGSLLAPIAKAWLTIKRQANDLDNQATVQKTITVDLAVDVGQVVTPGDINSNGEIVFFLTPSDTAPLSDQLFIYDVQILDANGGIYTPETGTITARPQITKAQG